MINSIIALIVTLILPVIVNWINPEIFEPHDLEIYEFEGDAFDVDNPTGNNNVNNSTGNNNVNNSTGIRGRCLVNPGRTDLVSLKDLGFKNIKDKSGGRACVNKAIVRTLKKLDGNLTFPIYISQGYNGTSSHYNRCHKAGKALDITIEPRDNIPRWLELGRIIKNVDRNASVIFEARCDYLCKDGRAKCHWPTDRCTQTCTEEKNGSKITWCQRPLTSGSKNTGARHIHACFK